MRRATAKGRAPGARPLTVGRFTECQGQDSGSPGKGRGIQGAGVRREMPGVRSGKRGAYGRAQDLRGLRGTLPGTQGRSQGDGSGSQGIRTEPPGTWETLRSPGRTREACTRGAGGGKLETRGKTGEPQVGPWIQEPQEPGAGRARPLTFA